MKIYPFNFFKKILNTLKFNILLLEFFFFFSNFRSRVKIFKILGCGLLKFRSNLYFYLVLLEVIFFWVWVI